MPSNESRQQLENLLEQAYNLKYELNRRLMWDAAPSVEIITAGEMARQLVASVLLSYCSVSKP